MRIHSGKCQELRKSTIDSMIRKLFTREKVSQGCQWESHLHKVMNGLSACVKSFQLGANARGVAAANRLKECVN